MVGSTITGAVDGRINSVEVTDIDGILIQAPEVARQKSYADANNSISIDLNWDSGAMEIAAWKAGVYLIKGQVDGGRGFSGVIVVDELAVFCEFIKGDYETPAKIKISSNGTANMQYLVRFATGTAALTTLKPVCADTEYEIGILPEETQFQVEITAYCYNETFDRTSETLPIKANYNSSSYNSPPVIEYFSPDPNSSVLVGEKFTASIVATDEDGDLLTYTWSASDPNAIEFSNPKSSETDVEISRTGKYILTAKATDGKDTDTEEIPLIVISEGETQEEDLNSLYEDANIVAGDQIVFRKKTGVIEIKQFRSLLKEDECHAYDEGMPVFALGKFNGWSPTNPAHEAEVKSDTVYMNINNLGLGVGGYGVGFAVIPPGASNPEEYNWWQDLQLTPRDQLFFGSNQSGGSVLVVYHNANGTLDNLPQGTVVEN
ncbi:MAG: hypothetical protein V1770_01700 [bacterium]